MITVDDEVRVKGTAMRHSFYGVVNRVYLPDEEGGVVHLLVRSHASGGQYYMRLSDVRPCKKLAKRPPAKTKTTTPKLAGHFDGNKRRRT